LKTLNDIVLFSRNDISDLFGIGANTVQSLFYNDEFPAIKVGRDWYVEENALRQYLQERHILSNLRAKNSTVNKIFIQ
jgi:hypothetical protein